MRFAYGAVAKVRISAVRQCRFLAQLVR